MNTNFTIDSRPERNYKDTLFRMIFGRENNHSAKWRLDLYNALSGKNHTNPEDLQLTTIENVIYITMKNDISFLVDSQMTLLEHQSTFNPNMPLRGFFYFSQLYQMHLAREEKDLFGSLVKIPAPRYIVFYNGDKKLPETSKLRLSDAFDHCTETGDFEWTATVININPEYNKGLQKNCKALYDYISYVDRVKSNQKNNMNIKDAVDEAVNWAIKENLLDGFFKEHKAEVTAVCLTEFDKDLYDKNRRKEAYEEGFENGEKSGAHTKAVEAAKKLLEDGRYTPQEISELLTIPIESFITTTTC